MPDTALITGGCGFIGSNLAARLLDGGWRVTLLDDLSRAGSEGNLRWLQEKGGCEFVRADVRNFAGLDHVVRSSRASAIFHLAGQVAMTTSLNDPRLDFETNVVGSINLLESVRRANLSCPVVYASSNKVYGDLAGVKIKEEATRYTLPDFPRGISETASLDFQTPYGCSKGAADQYMLDYARVFGLNTVVFRHSTIFGGRQRATVEQGWVGWFCQQALAVKGDPRRPPFTICGNGKQVRDLLFVDDAVECYLAAANRIGNVRGQAFNIGGGMQNSCSLLELFGCLEKQLNIELRYFETPWRPSDQKFFVADIAKAARELGWTPRIGRDEGIARTIAWIEETQKC